jgi:hypothetical protein
MAGKNQDVHAFCWQGQHLLRESPCNFWHLACAHVMAGLQSKTSSTELCWD